LIGKRWQISLLSGLFLLAGGLTVPARTKRAEPAASNSATHDKVLRYIRERYAVPDIVKLTLGPFRDSPFLNFREGVVTVDDGKQTRDQNILVSRDDRYLIVGVLVPLGGSSSDQIVRTIREQFKVPEAVKISVGPPRRSLLPQLLSTTITVDEGKHQREQDVELSRDGRFLVVGQLFDLNVDLKQQALRTISLRDRPSQGPANAPVTIVEYTDLECPMCARVHEFLEKELLPKYGDKVRLVFKEFPLVTIHDWSLSAAIADQCAYQINPATFVPFRSLIFRNQSSFNAANARDLLLTYGEQVGVDRIKLAGCLDSKAALPRVDEDASEAKRLNLQSTPTCFINGRMILGMPSADAYYKAVDEALGAAR
jgi:protein-disulfide isomerase